MGTDRHLIARQTIEIIAGDRADAETLSARTSGAAGRLAAVIERSLDSVDAAGLDLRIDRIELDLGRCDPARWEDALADGIRETLAGNIAAAVDRGEAVHRDPVTAALQLLDEFTRSGRLPWWAAPGDKPERAITVLTSAGCDPEVVRALLVGRNSDERLVNQLEEPALLSLVRLARPDLSEQSLRAISILADEQSVLVPAATVSPRAGRTVVWRAILAVAALPASDRASDFAPSPQLADGVDPAFERFRAAIVSRLGTRASPHVEREEAGTVEPGRDAAGAAPEEPLLPLPERLRVVALRQPSAAALFGRLAAAAPQLNARARQAVETLLDGGVDPADLRKLVAIFAEAGLVPISEVDRSSDTKAARRTPPGDEAHDAAPVANAGLVLLWPFLPRFFAGLDLLEDELFRDAATQHRAASLLHYLAGGDVTGPEQDMPLAKVLSGIDVDAVHDPGEPLAPLETAAADALLEAVLGHAPMLGRISLGGLREAFLMRPGLLSTRDGHWLLRAERRSIDVLLDRLPWTFAWVRLPWMAEPLQVEW